MHIQKKKTETHLPGSVQTGGTNVDGQQKLAVRSQLLVDSKRLFRDSTIFGLALCPGKCSGKERESFATEVAHSNACSGHDCHEAVECDMGHFGGSMLGRARPAQCFWRLGRKLDRKARQHEEAREQPQRFVAKHPNALFWCALVVLSLQNTSDAA